jgi:hypothetical protein
VDETGAVILGKPILIVRWILSRREGDPQVDYGLCLLRHLGLVELETFSMTQKRVEGHVMTRGCRSFFSQPFEVRTL